MQLFRFIAAFLACAFFAFPAKGAQSPSLGGPAVYMGEYDKKKATARVFLYLGENNNFLLCEEIAGSGTGNYSWEITGTWHQIRNNAFIQLTNSGLRRLLNVGGTGDLYLGVQDLRENDEIRHRTIVLRRQDSALHAKQIQSIPPKIRDDDYTPGYFLDTVVGKRWKVTSLVEEPLSEVYVVAFIPGKKRHAGKLEVFDGMRRVAGTYALEDCKITLDFGNADKQLASLAGKVQFWQLAGDVLELWNNNRIVALLEKMR